MTDGLGRSRNDGNPSIFVIDTKGARGAAALERALNRYSGGAETGQSLIAVGPDEWFLARAVQRALRAKLGTNMDVFTWLASQKGVTKVELLRGDAAMKRWYENEEIAVTGVHTARPRKVDRKPAPEMDHSWNVRMVGAPEAWEIIGWDGVAEPPWRRPGIKVGHLDTGVVEHPCLDLHHGDDDSDGHVLVHEGANVFDPHKDSASSMPVDPLERFGTPGHGLRTLSVLCGYQPGVFAGVAPRANIVPYRVTNFPVISAIVGTNASLAEGIRRATLDNGCRVLSMSLGNPCFPGIATGKAVDTAYEMGVIMVAAAGNVTSEVTYPGRYRRTIAVAGVSENRRPWAGGSRGTRVDVSAPADEVNRALRDKEGHTRPGYSTHEGDGTSYATAHVSAAAVLWLFHHWDEIERRYGNSWQRVEAFRHCLQAGAKPGPDWDSTLYGTGILWIPGLLETPLPEPDALTKIDDKAEDDLL